MRDKNVSLFVTCKNNSTASKNLHKNFFIFRLPNFESKLENSA